MIVFKTIYFPIKIFFTLFHVFDFILFIMDWITNLCSCISPGLKSSIIDYLNSSRLNSQVIEEEKCTEQDRQYEADPCNSENVYKLAKTKSYNFMKLEQHSDDENQHEGKKDKKNQVQHEQGNEEPDQLMDVFWYPVKKAENKWENYRAIFSHKAKILDIILAEEPSSGNYDKVYDSQDEIGLLIYCRLQSLVKGKKINSYRFSFKLNGFNLSQFEQYLNQVREEDIFPLLSSLNQIQKDPEDGNFCIKEKQYKKLLVINPHEVITAQKIQAKESQEKVKSINLISFSVKQQKEVKQKKNEGVGKGWLHLFGLEIVQRQNGLHFNGFMSLQLEVSISPSMLKQPISKEIRVCVQKFICSMKKSDQI